MHRNRAPHWKVEYTTASGAIGTITVQAGDPDDAKRITAEITRTDPAKIHGACNVAATERVTAPLSGRARR